MTCYMTYVISSSYMGTGHWADNKKIKQKIEYEFKDSNAISLTRKRGAHKCDCPWTWGHDSLYWRNVFFTEVITTKNTCHVKDVHKWSMKTDIYLSLLKTEATLKFRPVSAYLNCFLAKCQQFRIVRLFERERDRRILNILCPSLLHSKLEPISKSWLRNENT